MIRRRIAIIGPARTPIAEPFSGGLTAHIRALTERLCRRGHDVTLFAAPGSDPSLPLVELAMNLQLSETARQDVSMPPEVFLHEHHAYLALMTGLARQRGRFDVIHNHSQHHLPIALSYLLPAPMVTTLHTPPTPWLESAVQVGPTPPVRFVAVSRYTAEQWRPTLGPVDVVANGVDCEAWQPGPGGRDLVWSGRMVPEKAPHLAILAARLTGRRLVLAGPVSDPEYFAEVVSPLLGRDAVFAGHLGHEALSHLVRTSAVAVATPVWDEPYGLVLAEALASGTPVATFARGGTVEVVDESCARLAVPDDVASLARAIDEAADLDRAAARERAEKFCSLERMLDEYELVLDETAAA
ncbi:glycosyltransferase [uncultured Jatrophihabitans sp.]|uniref:glycosyltransferase n=1 Tax=uncultured Jatrophihabitans sp. TaxID=1610747 RepID=UPI0035CB1615